MENRGLRSSILYSRSSCGSLHFFRETLVDIAWRVSFFRFYTQPVTVYSDDVDPRVLRYPAQHFIFRSRSFSEIYFSRRYVSAGTERSFRFGCCSNDRARVLPVDVSRLPAVLRLHFQPCAFLTHHINLSIPGDRPD